jgi:hypothetical protein
MIFPNGGLCLSIDQWHLRYHFETCTFIQLEFMAKTGLQIALNFILSLLISQRCLNRRLSQLNQRFGDIWFSGKMSKFSVGKNFQLFFEKL